MEEEQTPKGHDVNIELEVSLKDLYLGATYHVGVLFPPGLRHCANIAWVLHNAAVHMGLHTTAVHELYSAAVHMSLHTLAVHGFAHASSTWGCTRQPYIGLHSPEVHRFSHASSTWVCTPSSIGVLHTPAVHGFAHHSKESLLLGSAKGSRETNKPRKRMAEVCAMGACRSSEIRT
jgi:hypothetical protein